MNIFKVVMRQNVSEGRPITRRGWAMPVDLNLFGVQNTCFFLYTVKLKNLQIHHRAPVARPLMVEHFS